MNAWQTVSETVVPRVAWTLVHSLWEAAAIAAVLAVMLRLMRNAAASWRYVACCIALAAVVISVGVTFTMLGESPAVRVDGAPSVFVVPDEAGEPVAVLPAPTHKEESAATKHENILRSVVAVWVAGVVVMALRQIGGWAWLISMRRGRTLIEFDPVMERLRRRLNIGRRVRLIETIRLDVPAVMGVLRPVIFIPLSVLNDLTPQQVEAILAHELAHVRRYDYLVNLLQAIVETLMFYHPAVWWISNRMRAEREHCCDDIAAAVCGDERLYASALTALECRRSAMPSAVVAATGGELLSRVRRLLKLPPAARSSRVGSARSIAIGVIALLCVAIAVVCFFAFGAKRDRVVDLNANGKGAPEYRYVDVLVDEQTMMLDGKVVDWTQLEAALAAIPEGDRKKTVIAVAASAPQVTVERYFDASNRLSELVTKYGLAYVSQAGIKQAAAAASNALPAGTESGEYYMDGHVRRTGVYSLTGRKISLRQALIAAGGVDAGFEKSQLEVIRRNGDVESKLAQNVGVDDVLNGRTDDIFLKPNDVIRVGTTSAAPATTQQAILGPPPEGATGEYYLDGEVPRTGVYNMTGRKITLKQAIAAGGGLEQEAKALVITVIRRVGNDKQEIPLDHVPADDLMEGRRADVYLWLNDIIQIAKKIPPATTQSSSASSDLDSDHRSSPITRDDLVVHAEDGQVKLRERVFSIIGQVERPGQYQISKSDYRILDALHDSGTKPKKLFRLFLLRKADRRTLEIPVKELIAGDMSGNIVVRPGDMIIIAPATPALIPSTATATTAPSTQAAAPRVGGKHFEVGSAAPIFPPVPGLPTGELSQIRTPLNEGVSYFITKEQQVGARAPANRPATTASSATQPLSRREDQAAALDSLQSCMSNLRYVDTAILFYGEQNGGNLPADLGATLKCLPSHLKWNGQETHWTEREKGQFYVCPDDAKTIQSPDQPTADWINQNTSYVYLGAANLKISDIKGDLGKVALAYERRTTGHEGSVPVLFVDGHVEAANQDQIPAIVKTSKAAFETAMTR